MSKKQWIVLALLVVTLALMLSGCGGEGQDLEGKYVAVFDLNGGKLDTRTSVVDTKINYAYEPDSLILDPTENADKKLGYTVSRAGYIFTGWYTDAECRAEQKWDFATGKITTEKLTLYAGWQKKIVYTYSVCYMNGEDLVKQGTYAVEAGAVFEDYLKYANKRNGYTPFGYYADAACTIPWDFATVHPGGDVDKDVPVYVSYIQGDWKIVDSYAKLKSSLGKGNIYLTADIDCGGEELDLGSFSAVFEGNGHTVTNFTVPQSESSLFPACAIFQMLGEGAKVQNVSFTNATYRMFGLDKAKKIKLAALALDAKNCTVSNVSVAGQLLTDYEGDLSAVNTPFFAPTGINQLDNVNIQIEIVVQPKT